MGNRLENFFQQTIFKWCSVLMLIIFVPVLFCVLVIGNNMDYWIGAKLTSLLCPTWVLGSMAVLGAAGFLGILYICRNISLSGKSNMIADMILAGAFLGIFLLNLMVSKEIAYKLGADMLIVRSCGYEVGMGKELGYYAYLSINPNNIPITYFLSRIYGMGLGDYACIAAGCALTSVGGFFACLTVKKLTKKLLPVIACFLAVFLLVECSAWKMVPYTDTYSISFSVMAVYLYLLSRDSDKKDYGKLTEVRRYAFLLVSLLCAGLGGLIKPSVYVVLIAVMGTELFRLVGDMKRLWLHLAAEILFIIVLMCGIGQYKEHMITHLGLEYNKEISASWHHYFRMGLNDATTGGYNPEDAEIFGEFQSEKKEIRNKAELERAFKRLRDKGIPGAAYFYVKKLVRTFNDATFGFGTEVRVYDYYPGLASETPRTELLRSIYWNGRWTGTYHTVCQLVWYILLIGIPGICLMRKRTAGFDILLISCLGILFYQIFFEASARYLFTFSPLLIAASICGFVQYVSLLEGLLQKKKSKNDENSAAAQLK